MSLQLASLLGDRHQQSGSELLLVSQHMCYHRGENRRGCMESLGIAPYNLRQALTRLEGSPAGDSILVLARKVTVQQMTYHFISLHSSALRWVTRKGDRR